MKKIFVIVICASLFSCRTTKVAAPAPDAVSKPTADTALQGDKLKDATKP